MSEPTPFDSADPGDDVFRKHLGVFLHPRGAHLLDRTRPLGAWVDRRAELGTWPYARTLAGPPRPETLVARDGFREPRLNFGSQDYLGLSSHPFVREAALRAVRTFGPHSAASPMFQGNSHLSRRLETALGEALGMAHVLLFPTGWAAGFGTITGLVRPGDHVLMDQLSHACLAQGARAATPNWQTFRHNDVADLRIRLAEVRARDARHGILVVTEGLFSMDSDSPDLAAMQAACREHGAVLLVDVAHDFGAQGAGGGGQLERQGLLGQVDLVMGSFSKTLASNGGFLATNEASVRQFVSIFGGSHTYSNALSPVQAAVVLEALRIVRSPEGATLRERSAANVARLRAGFAARRIGVIGAPSNVVPLTVGDEALARWTSRRLEESGLIANYVEFPAVPKGGARFRFQVMATHAPAQVDEAVDVFARCLAAAREEVAGDFAAAAAS